MVNCRRSQIVNVGYLYIVWVECQLDMSVIVNKQEVK